MQVPWVGLLPATAMVASVPDPSLFRSTRHFASWQGLAPRESSSSQRRRLGRISKRGSTHLRTLLIHGARTVPNRAEQLASTGSPRLTPLHRRALDVEPRAGHNRAAVALASRLARVVWAVWHHHRKFDAEWMPASVTRLTEEFSTRLHRDDQRGGERGRSRTGRGRQMAWLFICRYDQWVAGARKSSWPGGSSPNRKTGYATAVVPIAGSVRIASVNGEGVHIQPLGAKQHRCLA